MSVETNNRTHPQAVDNNGELSSYTPLIIPYFTLQMTT